MNGTIKSIFLSMVVMSASALPAITSAAPSVVIELFTSQGCSSCPPADALLGELARRPDIVALAYHVDYWDDLGWKDAFSIPEAAQRQRGYVSRLSRAGAFTPQAVVSGDTSLIGSNRMQMNEAIAIDRDTLPIDLSKVDANLRIRFPESWQETMDVYVVSYLDHATTQVGRGENAKKSLQEFNVVRSVKRIGRWNGKPQTMTVALATFPRDATAVAVLLQRSGQGAIAGAATTTLR
ncbi:DUF1223 domain-containing protein [Povalibacter sp.]|uniref:DUF1223 domain-containing protein n=1 Tax=Povalibacter sp. TaxID=1962978 RepID=UPI002F413504